MEQDDGEKVFLYVYDLTQGIARQLSTTFLGNPIEAVWHTGIGLYGKEYFFGPGILNVPIGCSPFGTPLEVLELGTTHVPKDVFEEYLQGIASRYSMFTYSLLNRNCNSFTDEAAKFLVGTGIPDHILKQADTAFDVFPLGATIYVEPGCGQSIAHAELRKTVFIFPQLGSKVETPLITQYIRGSIDRAVPMLQQLETTLRYGGVPTASSSPWPNPSAPIRSTSRSFMNGESSSSPFPTPAPPRAANVVPSVFPDTPIQPAPPRGSDHRSGNQESG